MFAPSLFCLWSDKKKEKEKSKKKENMACEEYRAESAELNVISSLASWRAWISSRVGKFKAQTITDPQPEPQQTLCSQLWRTDLLAANQVDRTTLNPFHSHGTPTWERMDEKPSKGSHFLRNNHSDFSLSEWGSTADFSTIVWKLVENWPCVTDLLGLNQ